MSGLTSARAGAAMGAVAADPGRDGTTHLVMSPMELLQRLAALVPLPRLHLIRLVSAQLRFAK